jgi:hypothetical protein
MKSAIVITPENTGKINSTLVSVDSVEKKTQLHKDLIEQRIGDVEKVLSGTEESIMKLCSKCVKSGERIALHPIEHFSLLNTGKRHSQCRRCRTDQANGWCRRRRNYRREYHQQYRKDHKLKPREGEDTRLRKNLQNLYIAVNQ